MYQYLLYVALTDKNILNVFKIYKNRFLTMMDQYQKRILQVYSSRMPNFIQ